MNFSKKRIREKRTLWGVVKVIGMTKVMTQNEGKSVKENWGGLLVKNNLGQPLISLKKLDSEKWE